MNRSAIPFHIPFVSGQEQACVRDAIARGTFAGGGYYTQQCEQQLKLLTGAGSVLLTSSCTHALEMCALLLEIQPGDEVIMSSFNFVSAANAFVLRGARIVFVDIDPATMNINPDLLEEAISDRTKAVLVMHYGGVACDMDAILAITNRHGLAIVEDAAHGIGAYYKNRHLGSMGDLGTLSFHATKNIHCGEGGALLINNPALRERAYILRDKGTNRRAFLQQEVDKYTWVDVGSSYFMSELSAAFLCAQLDWVEKVRDKRELLHTYYCSRLPAGLQLASEDTIRSNFHIYYHLCKTEELRNQLITYLQEYEVTASFHYVPLHLTKGGKLYSRVSGSLALTEDLAARLLRLPLHTSMDNSDAANVLDYMHTFYQQYP